LRVEEPICTQANRVVRQRTVPCLKDVEDDLLKEAQPLKAENTYLKIVSLGFGRRGTQGKSKRDSDKTRISFSVDA